MRITIYLPDELVRQARARAALGGMNLKDLIARIVEQGLRGTSFLNDQVRQRRSDLPVSRAATGRRITSLSNQEMQRILEEEETPSGRAD